MQGGDDPQQSVKIGWLNSEMLSDIASVRAIEMQGNRSNWFESKISEHLNTQNTVAIVARDLDGDILGWLLYRLEKNQVTILRFSVTRWRFREGIATRLVDAIKDCLSSDGKKAIATAICECHLPSACEFLQNCGFIATRVRKASPCCSDCQCESEIEMRFLVNWRDPPGVSSQSD